MQSVLEANDLTELMSMVGRAEAFCHRAGRAYYSWEGGALILTAIVFSSGMYHLTEVHPCSRQPLCLAMLLPTSPLGAAGGAGGAGLCRGAGPGGSHQHGCRGGPQGRGSDGRGAQGCRGQEPAQVPCSALVSHGCYGRHASTASKPANCPMYDKPRWKGLLSKPRSIPLG